MLDRPTTRRGPEATRSPTRDIAALGLAVLSACTPYFYLPDESATATASTSGDTTDETGGAAGSTDPTEGSTAPTCTKTGETGEPKCPESCADVLAATPGAADGAYTLHAGGDPARPWQAWCADMAGTSSEYLILQIVGPGFNFSEYLPGPEQSGTLTMTTYTRVRIDPRDFLVDVSDQTFSTSVGQLTYEGVTVSSMPYAVAMDCFLPNDMLGRGNIDLRDTPFTVPPGQFMVGGYLAAGTAVPSANNQVIDLRGGGRCGYIAPNPESDPAEPINGWGGFYLQLEYTL